MQPAALDVMLHATSLLTPARLSSLECAGHAAALVFLVGEAGYIAVVLNATVWHFKCQICMPVLAPFAVPRAHLQHQGRAEEHGGGAEDHQ